MKLTKEQALAVANMRATADKSFANLVRILDLDPAKDFQYADLAGVNFGDANLFGFNFTGSDLRGANLSSATISGAVFGNADMEGARWPEDRVELHERLGSASVAAHLPYLRRFARALLGSQQSGDAYVAALLEAVITEPNTLSSATDENIKVILYRILCDLIKSVAPRERAEQAEADNSYVWHLSQLELVESQAFLLMGLEGFSARDAARVMRATDPEFEAYIRESGRKLAGAIATDVLIVKESGMDVEFISKQLELLGHRIIGIANNAKDALAVATNSKPGLIIIGGLLHDGTRGVTVARKIVSSDVQPVVLIIGHRDAVLAEELKLDLNFLETPFDKSEFSAVVSKLLFFVSKNKKTQSARHRDRDLGKNTK